MRSTTTTTTLLTLVAFLLVVGEAAGAITKPMRKHRFEPGEIQPTPLAKTNVFNRPMAGGVWPQEAFSTVIEVGTPSQSIMVLLDSGSSDLLLDGRGCQGCNKSSAAEFDVAASKSATQISCETSVHCAQCNDDVCYIYNEYITCVPSAPTAVCVMTGPVYQDVMGVEDTNLEVVATFAVVSMMNITFPLGMAGIWGLAGVAGSGLGVDAPFALMVNEGELKNEFAMCFTTEGGAVTFGGVDSTLYTGSIMWTKMIPNQGWYTVSMLSLDIDGVSTNAEPQVFIVDSGTMQLEVLPHDWAVITATLARGCTDENYANLTGTCGENPGLFNSVCYAMSPVMLNSFPQLSLNMADDVTLTVDFSGYLYENPRKEWCLGIFSNGYTSSTYGGQGIIGNLFLTSYYTVFDNANNRMGFAEVSSKDCRLSSSQ